MATAADLLAEMKIIRRKINHIWNPIVRKTRKAHKEAVAQRLKLLGGA